MTFRLLAVSLFVAAVAPATPTYTNTGSATTTCFGPGITPFTISATGSTVTLACPAPYSGSAVMGYAGSLATEVSLGRPWLQVPAFSFQSSLSDTITSDISTMAEFTLTYDWSNIGDDGQGLTAGDLLFNGLPIWSRRDLTCLYLDLTCWDQAAYHHTIVAVIDEPVSAGVPFSYQADVASSSAGSFFPGEANNMTVSMTLLPAPEPATCLLVGMGIFLALASSARWRIRSKSEAFGIVIGSVRY